MEVSVPPPPPPPQEHRLPPHTPGSRSQGTPAGLGGGLQGAWCRGGWWHGGIVTWYVGWCHGAAPTDQTGYSDFHFPSFFPFSQVKIVEEK